MMMMMMMVHTCRLARCEQSNVDISFVVMSTCSAGIAMHMVHLIYLAFTLVKGILHSPIVAEQESFPQCAQQLSWPFEF